MKTMTPEQMLDKCKEIQERRQLDIWEFMYLWAKEISDIAARKNIVAEFCACNGDWWWCFKHNDRDVDFHILWPAPDVTSFKKTEEWKWILYDAENKGILPLIKKLPMKFWTESVKLDSFYCDIDHYLGG